LTTRRSQSSHRIARSPVLARSPWAADLVVVLTDGRGPIRKEAGTISDMKEDGMSRVLTFHRGEPATIPERLLEAAEGIERFKIESGIDEPCKR
jgi:hypothetical protein